MKTTCFLLVTLFFAAVLVCYGGFQPVFDDCTGGTATTCPGSDVIANFSGLDPSRVYDADITETGPCEMSNNCQLDGGLIYPDASGHGSIDFGFLNAGTWDLVLSVDPKGAADPETGEGKDRHPVVVAPVTVE